MFALSKLFRLKNENQIKLLFDKGKTITYGGITLKYLQTNDELKVGFSAPKRRFPKAVLRNKIKRRMRESFRLQYREILGVDFKGLGYFVFTTKKEVKTTDVHRAFTNILTKWKNSEA